MPSRHTELLWSPHFPEVFAIGSSEHLKLYEFSGTEERQAQQKVQLIGSVTDVQQLKWCSAGLVGDRHSRNRDHSRRLLQRMWTRAALRCVSIFSWSLYPAG